MKFSGCLLRLGFLCFVQWGACKPPASENGHNARRFEITLTWEDWEVAGAVRKTILTNGKFPGPKLQLKQGDDVEFLVNNLMPFSTSVHFHGVLSHAVCAVALLILSTRYSATGHSMVRRRTRPFAKTNPAGEPILVQVESRAIRIILLPFS